MSAQLNYGASSVPRHPAGDRMIRLAIHRRSVVHPHAIWGNRSR
jgi:hypothetical protein